MTQRGETVGAVFPANFMKRMEFIMNKFAENSIEEKVKKELEGNILMAYCNGIISGVEQYYKENRPVFYNSELDNASVEKVKEAYPSVISHREVTICSRRRLNGDGRS